MKEQLSFEKILSWFGTFTPQLKFKLMMIKRRTSLEDFENKTKEIMSLFRSYLSLLERQSPGAERARWLFRQMDLEIASMKGQKFSCGEGCSACCRVFPKQITDDEADLLIEEIANGAPVDLVELNRQYQAMKSSEPSARQSLGGAKCVFLDDKNGSCQVYTSRPAVCRKYNVVSPSEECSKADGQVVPHIELTLELLTSAALSVSNNKFDFMPIKLGERLEAISEKGAPQESSLENPISHA
jgi:Fe-S-cluster containining protein